MRSSTVKRKGIGMNSVKKKYKSITQTDRQIDRQAGGQTGVRAGVFYARTDVRTDGRIYLPEVHYELHPTVLAVGCKFQPTMSCWVY